MSYVQTTHFIQFHFRTVHHKEILLGINAEFINTLKAIMFSCTETVFQEIIFLGREGITILRTQFLLKHSIGKPKSI